MLYLTTILHYIKIDSYLQLTDNYLFSIIKKVWNSNRELVLAL